MKTRKFLYLITGVLVGALMFGGVGWAAGTMNIEVHPKPFHFVFSGEEQKPSDKEGKYFNGKAYVPSGFIFKGTTYVPLRFIGESLGNKVGWDGETNTITIDEKGSESLFQKIKAIGAPEEIAEWVEQSKRMELAQTKTFEDKTYILITRGQKPTAGYSVDITNMEDKGTYLEAEVDYTDPGSMVNQVITYPYVLAVMDEVDKPVRFTEKDGHYISTLKGTETLLPIIEGSDNIKLFEPVKEEGHLLIHGVARVFEATLQFDLKEEGSKDTVIVEDGTINTAAGAPDWGYFTLEVSYDDVENENVVLELFTSSPKDGSRQNEVELPLSGFEMEE